MMYIDVFWVWPFLFGFIGLLILIAIAATLDHVEATRKPTQPPDRVVLHKTQAVRKDALPDVKPRVLKSE